MAANSGSRALTPVLATVAAILAVVAAGVAVFLVMSAKNNDEAAPAPVITVTESAPAPAPVEAPAEVTVEIPAGSTPVESGPCLPSEVRQFGTDANGGSLVCLFMGGDRYSWVRHGERSDAVHNIGDPCDSAVDRVAQDPSGAAIMCGGQTWIAGP